MKKLVLPAIGLLASLLSAQAQPAQYFFPTNLVVVQQVTTTLDGAAATIVQLETNGTTVGLPAGTNLPTGSVNPFCLGANPTEGFVTLSANTNFLVLGGYSVTPPLTGAPGLKSSTVAPRAIATLDAYDIYALPISNVNAFSADTVRGAASDGLGNFWMSGSGGGVAYMGTAASQEDVMVTETGSGIERCLDVFNGNLYVSVGASAVNGVFVINNIGGTYPEAATGNANVISMSAGSPSASSYAFEINGASTIAYVADQALGGIVKFTSTGPSGVWTSNYTLSTLTAGVSASTTGATNAYGVTADFTGSTPVIYATTAEAAPNRLVRIVDTNANATAVAIGVVPGGTVWRSVKFAPGAYPLIASQTPSQLTDNGQNVTFSVDVLGTPTLTYQWYSNSAPGQPFYEIPSATSATLTLTDVAPAQSNTTYYVTVANAYGTAQSTNSVLTVNPPGPPILVEATPSTQTVNAGSNAVFTGTFVGSQTGLSYGWTHNGTPVSNGAFGSSTNYGATTPTLTISNVFAIDDGNYVFTVTNNDGHASSSAAVLTVNDPAIVTNVMGVTNFPGNGTVPLSVFAVGTGLSYQWYSNNVLIVGATSSNYTAPNKSTPFSTSYTVVITSTDGSSVTNGPAIVAFSDLLVQENFNYPNGSDLFTTPGSPWTVINTTEGAPEIVYTNTAQVSDTNATTDSQDLFNTNVLNEINGGNPDGVYWVSFTVSVSKLPTSAGGVYFANLEDKDYNFYGRIFVLTSNIDNVQDNWGAYLSSAPPTLAYPGTYRLGISDSQGDYATNGTSGPTAVVPLDLAPGITYTVVYALDYDNLYSRMAINPASSSDVLSFYPVVGVCSGAADDTFVDTTIPPLGYGLRQRGGEGVLYVGNLKVAAEANLPDGYGYVTAGTTAADPVIGLQPVGTSNYLGNPFTMEVAASGIGTAGVGLSYAWYKNTLGNPTSYGVVGNSGDVTGAGTPTLSFSSFGTTDAGTYYVIVTGAAGSTQSGSTVISLNTTPTPPSFTAAGAVNPSGTPTVAEGDTVTLTGTAIGTGPISYQWYLNTGSGYSSVYGPSSSPTYSFEAEPALSGSYELVATGAASPAATSGVTVLTVTGPTVETIDYLRNLQDVSAGPAGTYTVNGTSLFTITGIITVATNITSGNTSSYYLQDSTGGMNFFITGDSTFRPTLGDVVTATGTLSEYYNNLELDVAVGTPYETYSDLTVTDPSQYPAQPLPTAQLLPWGYWNSNPANTSLNIDGSIVMLTNVYFVSNSVNYGASAVFTNSHDYYDVTNNTGETFDVYVSEQNTNFNGEPIPPFAYSVTGVLQENSSPDPVFSIIVSRYSDIVTTEPPQPIQGFAGMVSGNGNNLILNWTAVPNTESYSVLTSTNVAGPYTNKLATGLTFSTAQGTYPAPIPSVVATFYLISSP
jgi:hypothetical protein